MFIIGIFNVQGLYITQNCHDNEVNSLKFFLSGYQLLGKNLSRGGAGRNAQYIPLSMFYRKFSVDIQVFINVT